MKYYLFMRTVVRHRIKWRRKASKETLGKGRMEQCHSCSLADRGSKRKQVSTLLSICITEYFQKITKIIDEEDLKRDMEPGCEEHE